MCDFPRPPRVEVCLRRLAVELARPVVASTDRSWRVLETSHPPTYDDLVVGYGGWITPDVVGPFTGLARSARG